MLIKNLQEVSNFIRNIYYIIWKTTNYSPTVIQTGISRHNQCLLIVYQRSMFVVTGLWYAPGELIFNDEFDVLSSETWEHEITMAGGGNWEFQAYTHNRSNR